MACALTPGAPYRQLRWRSMSVLAAHMRATPQRAHTCCSQCPCPRHSGTGCCLGCLGVWVGWVLRSTGSMCPHQTRLLRVPPARAQPHSHAQVNGKDLKITNSNAILATQGSLYRQPCKAQPECALGMVGEPGVQGGQPRRAAGHTQAWQASSTRSVN